MGRPWTLRRKWSYPLLGILLAQGAPLGLLLLRTLHALPSSLGSWLAAELTGNALTYGYLAIATSVVFALLGRWIGARQDALLAASTTDTLTGLANRRHLEDRLAQELARARRYRTPVSVVLFDLDHLKAINDQSGHRAGDRALAMVADTLRKSCRATDLPARFGGDEFIVLLPETRAAEAAELGERIRASLATLPGSPTVSVGVADTDVAGTFEGPALCAVADHALYEAKAKGRNAVVIGARPAAELTPRAPVTVANAHLSPEHP